MGASTTVSISLGMDLVAGKNRVPNPAAGITAFVIVFMLQYETVRILFGQIKITCVKMKVGEICLLRCFGKSLP